ncbi:MAG: dsDNA nuclease domain-containing protein [Chloroflexota bacterium]
MAQRILDTPQISDPGTEGLIGYDYQRDLTVMLCIRMIENHQIENVVCEFHEDIVQIKDHNKLEFVQVKKTQSKTWTLHNFIAPEKRQKLGVLGKLFTPVQNGKDVVKIAFWGHGKLGLSKDDGELSLGKLVALLNTPENSKDEDWQLQLNRFTEYLTEQLSTQGINAETVKTGLLLLDIDLSYPHPSAIENENYHLLLNTLKKTWSIELTLEEAKIVCNEIYSRVRQISHQPLQPWTIKSISRLELIDIVLKRAEEFSPSANRETTLTTQEKLTRVELETKTKYAFQKRLNTMALRYETSIESAEWQSYRTELDIVCRKFRVEHPSLTGPELWQGLVAIFFDLGNKWGEKKNDMRFGYDFAEGIFFDMTGICEVKWMRNKSNGL